jgi:hypothetical protein
LRTGEYTELWNQKFEEAIESNPALMMLAAKCSKFYQNNVENIGSIPA